MALTVTQKIFLARSPEFQKLIAEDPVLRELEHHEIDRGEELLSLLEMLRGTLRIGELTVQPVTPAIWAFLWAIGNRYTIDVRTADELDTDVFLYLLANGVRSLDCELAGIPARASGFCEQNGLAPELAMCELVKMIDLAFRPLEMLPLLDVSEDDPETRRFDADWLARISGAVARETNEPARRIMFDMPLSACYYYIVNAKRREDPKGLIRPRTPAEINMAILARVDALGEQFCKEHYHAGDR